MSDNLAVMKLDIILDQVNTTQATPVECISCAQISDLSVPEAESVVSRFVMKEKNYKISHDMDKVEDSDGLRMQKLRALVQERVTLAVQHEVALLILTMWY